MESVKEEPISSDMGIGVGMTGAPPENVQWPPSNNIKELQTKPNLDCMICGKKFKFESAMKVHVKMRGTVWPCTTYRKNTGDPIGHAQLMRKHTGAIWGSCTTYA